MAIIKRAFLNQTTIDEETGALHLRYAKVMEVDGVEVGRGWHRDVIMPGDDIDARMAEIATHLEMSGEAMPGGPFPLEAATVTKVKKRVKDEHTPARIKAHKDRVKAEEAKMAAVGHP